MVADCPTVESQSEAGICFRCGSSQHPLKACPTMKDPKNPFPYATCYICKELGHISALCPANEKGVYVKGGGCRKCGSVRHRAQDCDVNKKVVEEDVLDILQDGQGGDTLGDDYSYKEPERPDAMISKKKRKVVF